MQVAVVKETFPGEQRVALVPGDVAKLAKNNITVILEPGAGLAAGFADKARPLSADIFATARGSDR